MTPGKSRTGIGGLDVPCANALRRDQGTYPARHGSNAIRRVPRRWLFRRPPVLGEIQSPLRCHCPLLGEPEEAAGEDAS